jgi:hypothetical protein
MRYEGRIHLLHSKKDDRKALGGDDPASQLSDTLKMLREHFADINAAIHVIEHLTTPSRAA